MNLPVRRLAALGGVIGPAAFIVAWAVASSIAPRYSASDDAISELAAVRAQTRLLMTGGFVALALCATPYAMVLRSALGGRAWIAAAGTGVAILLLTATRSDGPRPTTTGTASSPCSATSRSP